MKTVLKKSFCLALLLVYARCNPGADSNTSDSSIKKYAGSKAMEPSNSSPALSDSTDKWIKFADSKRKDLEREVKYAEDKALNNPR